MYGPVNLTGGLDRGDLYAGARVIVREYILVGDGDDVRSVRSGDYCGGISSFLFHFPSSARMQRAMTKDGQVDTSPSQMLSIGAERVAYAADLERVERSIGSNEENGSKILIVEGVALSKTLISVTSKHIASASVVLVVDMQQSRMT